MEPTRRLSRPISTLLENDTKGKTIRVLRSEVEEALSMKPEEASAPLLPFSDHAR